VLIEISRITGRSSIIGYVRTRVEAERMAMELEEVDDRYIVIIKEVVNLG
jgi:hypothetical protein